jgi:hypothetical protein
VMRVIRPDEEAIISMGVSHFTKLLRLRSWPRLKLKAIKRHQRTDSRVEWLPR